MTDFKINSLTKKQNEVLNLIYSGLCVNRGVDGFRCNARTLHSLQSKGFIFFGRFERNGELAEIGWQYTESAKTTIALIKSCNSGINHEN
ncbi:hypothetical protein [Vibrio harveyi]|uniref:hypothetical protein n=1 Tax=Vibrio harveyi TaxID=669 RepID=UPI000D78AD17|nr:hypothetical protein [Vibrio harveyi]